MKESGTETSRRIPYLQRAAFLQPRPPVFWYRSTPPAERKTGEPKSETLPVEDCCGGLETKDTRQDCSCRRRTVFTQLTQRTEPSSRSLERMDVFQITPRWSRLPWMGSG